MACMHHPLALTLATSCLLYYVSLRPFHLIAISLLLVAGITYITGSYKFTLDPTKKSDFYQFKAIVLLQLISNLYARGYMWFPQAYLALKTFHNDGAMGFFYGGCVISVIFTVF